MILVRDTFQVKFGHMDAMLDVIKEATESGADIGSFTRVLTDASGKMFTLIIESKVESIDAYRKELMERFGSSQSIDFMKRTEPHIESGQREFYTIEWEKD